MANEQNLIPFNQRTESEQRKIATEGGKASGESRRRRKTLKDSMNTLLELPISSQRDFNKLVKMGVNTEDIDNSQLITLALFNQAKCGDVAAIRELRNLIGEDGPQPTANKSTNLLDAIAGQTKDIYEEE